MKKYMMLLVVVLLVATAVLGIVALSSAYKEVEQAFEKEENEGTSDQGGGSTDQGGDSTDQGGGSTDQGGSDLEPTEPEKIDVGAYSYYTDNRLTLIDGTYSAFDNASSGNVSNTLLHVYADNGEIYVEKGWEPEAGCNVSSPIAKFTVDRWTSFAFFYRVYDVSKEAWSDYQMVTGAEIGLWYINHLGDIVEVSGRVEINPSDDLSAGTYDLYFEIPAGSEIYGNTVRLYCFQSN